MYIMLNHVEWYQGRLTISCWYACFACQCPSARPYTALFILPIPLLN